MGLLVSIHFILTNPTLLGSFLFNAVIGTAAFVAAIYSHNNNKTNMGYLKKYLLLFLSVNFIARCFLVIISPGDLAAGVILNGISVASAMMLFLGAVFNALSKHVSERVISRYRQK
jgi:hypothetical protein